MRLDCKTLLKSPRRLNLLAGFALVQLTHKNTRLDSYEKSLEH